MLGEFIKHKLAKLGCFVCIAITAAFFGLLTTWVLSRSGDPAAETKGKQATALVAKVLFVGTIVLGLCGVAHERWAKWRARQPPPLPSSQNKTIQMTGKGKPPPKSARFAGQPYESNYDGNSHYQR